MKSEIFTNNNLKYFLLAIITHVIIPSVLFWLISQKIYIVRSVINIDYLVLGILVLFFRKWIFVSIWLTLFSLDILSAIAPSFFFHAYSMLLASKFVFSLNLLKYPFLFSGLAILSLCFGILWKLVAATYQQMNKRVVVWLAICLFLIVSIDITGGTNWTSRYFPSYMMINRNVASSGIYNLFLEIQKKCTHSNRRDIQFVESAMSHTLGRIGSNISDGVAGRHFVLIIVESWGMLHDDRTAQKIMAPLLSLSYRYNIHTGSVPFTGATTTAELRELGGIHGDYNSILNGSDFQWIPRQLAVEGFSTIAIHGFSGHMFDRDHWWPLIGFTQVIFPQDLIDLNLPQCGGVFAGICDESIAGYIGTLLQKEKGRSFVYWLTLNTHLPLERKAGENSIFNCEGTSLTAGSQECRLAKMHSVLFQAIADKIAASKALPPVHILIVGDHMSPLSNPDARFLYNPERVPYVELRPKPSMAKYTR